jgi:TRAP-type C4-dicarboxylate transport system permease small subunit
VTMTNPAGASLLDRFCRLLDLASAAALAAMAAMVFGNVVLRYVFNSGIAVSEELSRWLFVWMTFLGAVVALKENGHLGTDMLVSRLGRTGKRLCMAASQLLMLGCTVMLFMGSLAQVKINWEVEAPVTGWSMAVVYLPPASPSPCRPRCCCCAAVAHGQQPAGRRRTGDGAGVGRPGCSLQSHGQGRTAMTVAIFLGALLGAMALGMPIAYALLVCGVALMVHLDMFDAQILAQNLINGADSFPLLAVPFFMLAGEIMNAGGLSRRIVKLALTVVGHVRGGLGYVTIMAAVMMAALSGSAVADTAALAALLLPMMVRAGHDKARAGGLIASAGIIAPVIPPSIGFVIFGVAANVSIGKLFMAGIVPGILLGVALAITWWWVARNENVAPPPGPAAAEVLAAAARSSACGRCSCRSSCWWA